jgi:hypothetical protein
MTLALKILQTPCNLLEILNFQLPMARIFIGIQSKGFEMVQACRQKYAEKAPLARQSD